MSVPRTWSLPPEPGPEVTAVVDRFGTVWRHIHGDRWAFRAEEPLQGATWVGLLHDRGPLTDATPSPLSSAEATAAPEAVGGAVPSASPTPNPGPVGLSGGGLTGPD